MEINASEALRHEARNNQARVLCEHAPAPAEAPLLQAFVDDRGPFPLDFEPHDVGSRIELEPLHSEPAASWADFELHGSRGPGTMEDRPQIEGPFIGEPRRVGVGVDEARSRPGGVGIGRHGGGSGP